MLFSELREQLDTLAGLDLSTTDRDLLLNEGYRELSVRSAWNQRQADLGPTVNGTATYATPTTLHRILNVSVGGKPYTRVPNRQVAEEIVQGTRAFRADGIYWLHYDNTSVEYVNLAPTPSSAVALTARIVFIPNDMTSPSDVPALPAAYHRAIVDYAAAQAYALDEDNVELAGAFMADFERRLDKLAELRRGRASELDYIVQQEQRGEPA